MYFRLFGLIDRNKILRMLTISGCYCYFLKASDGILEENVELFDNLAIQSLICLIRNGNVNLCLFTNTRLIENTPFPG